METRHVTLDLIDRDPDQPRQAMELQELKELASSIQRLGQLQPVIVYQEQGRFRTVDGHRRVEAMRMLEAKQALALILPSKPDDEQTLMTQLAANCMRVDLKPMEKARAFARLKTAKGWNQTELASAIGMSKSAVTRVLSYLDLPEQAQQLLDAGKLPQSTAYAISRSEDVATQLALMEKAANGKLNRDEAQRVVARNRSPKRQHSSRVSLCVGPAIVSIATEDKLKISDYVGVLQALIKELRRADKQGLDVKTTEKVLQDRAIHSSS